MYTLVYKLRNKTVREENFKSVAAAKRRFSALRKEDDEKVMDGRRKDYNLGESAAILNEFDVIRAERYNTSPYIGDERYQWHDGSLDEFLGELETVSADGDIDDSRSYDVLCANPSRVVC